MFFAPIVNSSQPAFNYKITDYDIGYTIPDKVSQDEIKHIGVRIVKQNNNENIANLQLYPDGIISKPFGASIISRYQTVTISSSDLVSSGWFPETYYKIQVRFGKDNYYDKKTWEAGEYVDNLGKVMANSEKLMNDEFETIQKTVQENDTYIYQDQTVEDYYINEKEYLISNGITEEMLSGSANIPEEDTQLSGRANLYKEFKPLYVDYQQATLAYNNVLGFSGWKQYQIKESNFSEWSTVMVVKAIEPPLVEITNNPKGKEITNFISLLDIKLETNTNPLFEGIYRNTGNEIVTHYKFDLYDITNIEEQLLESSNWLVHDSSQDNIYKERAEKTSGDQCRFKQALNPDPNENKIYKVIYSVRTQNLWEGSDSYTFRVLVNNTSQTSSFEFLGEANNEDGYIELKMRNPLNTNLHLTNGYVISRADERSQFQIWEDIKFFTLTDFVIEATPKNNVKSIYTDYTVESGIQYKYAIQTENRFGLRSERQEAFSVNGSNNFQTDFEHCYLYDNDVQLKIKFDPNISSFKKTILTNKQDTLGGKYPVVMRNAQANYAEFSIGGLISLHGDDNCHFFQKREKGIDNTLKSLDGYYYRDELVIPYRKLDPNYIRTGTGEINSQGETISSYDPQEVPELTFGTNLTSNNMFVERIFREKVIEFLNDGRYKLFKSPTEGNIVVALTNVSTTPNKQLGRMISSFTSTAYEIMENTYDNLVKYGIVDQGNSQIFSSDNIYAFGQISPTDYDYTKGQLNINDIIKEQISNKQTGDDNYSYVLNNIESISLEAYPSEVLKEEIMEIQAQIHNALGSGKTEEEISDLRIEQTRLKTLLELLRSQSTTEKYKITIGNSPELLLGLNQVFYLDEVAQLNTITTNTDGVVEKQPPTIKIITTKSIEDSSEQICLPIIINYVVSCHVVENTTNTITSTNNGLIWGQIAGIFSEDEAWCKAQQELTKMSLNSNISKIYNTLDIDQIIKEQAIQEVAKALGEEVIFKKDLTSELEKERYIYQRDANRSYVLSFNGYEKFEIETDKFIQIEIERNKSNKNEEQENYTQTVLVGPTNKYIIKYAKDLDWIQKVRFKNINTSEIDNVEGYNCIVDYLLSVTVEEKGIGVN